MSIDLKHRHMPVVRVGNENFGEMGDTLLEATIDAAFAALEG